MKQTLIITSIASDSNPILKQWAVEAKQNNTGASSSSKVSLGNISQSSFSLLEKNGFTIQKIGPNEFSAFKEL